MTTDEVGVAIAGNLAHGRWLLDVRAAGHLGARTMVEVPNPADPTAVNVEVALDRLARIEGVVLDSAGAPAPAASVRFMLDPAEFVDQNLFAAEDRAIAHGGIGTADEAGRFALEAIPPRVVGGLLVMGANGRAEVRVSALQPGQSASIEVRLRPSTELRGYVPIADPEAGETSVFCYEIVDDGRGSVSEMASPVQKDRSFVLRQPSPGPKTLVWRQTIADRTLFASLYVKAIEGHSIDVGGLESGPCEVEVSLNSEPSFPVGVRRARLSLAVITSHADNKVVYHSADLAVGVSHRLVGLPVGTLSGTLEMLLGVKGIADPSFRGIEFRRQLTAGSQVLDATLKEQLRPKGPAILVRVERRLDEVTPGHPPPTAILLQDGRVVDAARLVASTSSMTATVMTDGDGTYDLFVCGRAVQGLRRGVDVRGSAQEVSVDAVSKGEERHVTLRSKSGAALLGLRVLLLYRPTEGEERAVFLFRTSADGSFVLPMVPSSAGAWRLRILDPRSGSTTIDFGHSLSKELPEVILVE